MTNNPHNRKYSKPIRISEPLKNINNNFSAKFGKLEFMIHYKWEEIVGVFFNSFSEPIKIKNILNANDQNNEPVYEKYLHVNVSPSIAVEFQHFQKKIIEKINSYFGFSVIKGIKIHQKFINKEKIDMSNKTIKLDIDKNIKKIKNIKKNIHDESLEKSLYKLGLSIKNEEK